MKAAFEEIGSMIVTFAASDGQAGQVCAMAENATVAPCTDGQVFIGVMEESRAGFAGVRIHGFAEVAYTGSAPGLGYVKLAANGSGGVKVSEAGREHLVVSVDENAGKAIIEL
jgi:hypothetical protein